MKKWEKRERDKTEEKRGRQGKITQKRYEKQEKTEGKRDIKGEKEGNSGK